MLGPLPSPRAAAPPRALRRPKARTRSRDSRYDFRRVSLAVRIAGSRGGPPGSLGPGRRADGRRLRRGGRGRWGRDTRRAPQPFVRQGRGAGGGPRGPPPMKVEPDLEVWVDAAHPSAPEKSDHLTVHDPDAHEDAR